MTEVAASLRGQIDQFIDSGDAQAARAALLAYWREEGPTAAAASFLCARFERIRDKLPLTPYRVSILRSYTVEPVVPLLRAMGFAAGLDLAIHLGEFNAYAQELLDSSNALYAFAPQAVILAVETRAIAPDLWYGSANQEAGERVARDFRAWLQHFRNQSQAHLIAHTFEQPEWTADGLLDSQSTNGQRATIEALNSELRRIASAHTGVWILDYDALVARHGRRAWHDERKWLTVRFPLAAASLPELAAEWIRFLHPLSGKIAKAIVVDLDNTLWGGVIGEDGMKGIRLGTEYPGAAFQELQRVLLRLSERGILLAIASKNNPDDAMEVLDSHPAMLLRRKHFSALRVSWSDKAQSLREIAEELNIGIDSLAFLDDNPVEREHVRSAAPEVHVLDLPRDPMDFARYVAACPLFERLALSPEDRQRTEMYQAQSVRAELERGATSKEDFYRALEQKAEVARVSPATLARTAQLTQKTNQFNLTTKRYSEQEIAAIAASPACVVYTLGVRDRFADNGLVGVAIVRHSGESAEIDTFLMSCRVIGRTVETAFLSYLVSQAESAGVRRIEAWFLPTKKNAPARDFYARHGFRLQDDTAEGSKWVLDLPQHQVRCPEWIEFVDGGSHAAGSV